MGGIILTDEMIQAFSRVFFRDPLGVDVRAGLAAVLAIIERDYGATLRCTACAGNQPSPFPRPGR